MTDLRKAAEMALNAMEFNDPLIEDYGSKEQLNSHKEAIVVLYKALAQPETGCADCGKKASEGYALYCVKCTESFKPDWDMIAPFHERIKELEIALAQSEQEPVAWVRDLTSPSTHCVTSLKYLSIADTDAGVKYIPVYTAPPSKPWQSLTDVEVALFETRLSGSGLAREIEAKLRERNT